MDAVISRFLIGLYEPLRFTTVKSAFSTTGYG